MTPKREAILVLKAQSGDREALDFLIQLHQDALFGYVSGIVRNRELAQDVVQDVFVIICRKVKHLRDPRVFRAWVFRIASREAVRAAEREEKRRKETRVDSALLALTPELQPEGEGRPQWLDDLPALLDGVSPASRSVLLLHFLEEMPLDAVSDVLGIPLGTVKSRLAYGLNTLRKSLQFIRRTSS